MYGVDTGRKPVLLHEMLLFIGLLPFIRIESWIGV